MSTYVLVHGAWGGSYGWRHVRPLLQQAGHTVFTPSLTGLGERAHLATPEVNLTTHIQDVYNAIWYEDLTDIILVGHSYGGMVVTGVADQYARAHPSTSSSSTPSCQTTARACTTWAAAASVRSDWRVPPLATHEAASD